MKTIRLLIAITLFLLLIAACAPGATSTPEPVRTSPFDGNWKGTGRASDGRELMIAFRVRAGKIIALDYGYQIPEALPCMRLDHDPLPEENWIAIANSRIETTLGDDLILNAVFDSDNSAAGHIQIDWRGRSKCVTKLEGDWTAIKQEPIAAPAPIKPRGVCGYIGCGEIFLQLLIYGLSNGSILALNAIGVTVIYSTVRTLNLAHGDVFALTTVVVTSLVNGIGIQRSWPPLQLAGALILVLCIAAAFGAVLSMGINQIAFKPFRGRSRLAPLIATLGISFMLFQLALVWRTFQASWIPGEHRSVPGLPEVPTDRIPDLFPGVDLIRAAQWPIHVSFHINELLVILIALAFAIGVHLFMQRSKTGRALRACAQNPQLAEMSGVDFDRSIQRAFAIGGALAGAAAFIFALYYARPLGDHGAQSGLLAFAAALLGGIGSPFGALFAGILLGVFASFSDYFLSAQWTPILSLALLIGLLILRPTGVASKESSEDALSQTLRDSIILTGIGKQPRGRFWIILIFAALAIFPLISGVFNLGGQIILISIGIFMLLALGLNLLLGLAGVLDLGYAVSFGVGGYAAAILMDRSASAPLDFTLVLIAAIVIAGFFGLLKGSLALRLRGDYLAVATLALALLGQKLIVMFKGLTGGPTGIGPLPAPHWLAFILVSPNAKYYLSFALVALAAWISQRLIHSRTGRTWLATSEDELAASSFGVNAARYRMLAFVLSSALAGMAGALQAGGISYVDPGLMAFHISIMTLTMVIIGGAGSVPGALIGALVIIGYDKVIVPQAAALIALIWPANAYIGPVPDLRGASYFNFGLALYLTVLIRARGKTQRQPSPKTIPDLEPEQM
jgi:branched-chain amino acid transport system permease protein